MTDSTHSKGAGHGGPARGAGRGGPARGYTRPPAEPGNALALRHGARSARKVSALAVELTAGLLADRPDLTGFPEAVTAWGRAEARCILLDEWITEHGLLDEDGEPTTGAVKYLAAWETQAATARARLGLDPRAEAELARERVDARRSVIDLEAVRARGLEVVARRLELSGPDDADDDGDASGPDVPGGST